MPDPFKAYSTKAEKYARYRWDYAPQAVEAIFEIAGLSRSSVVADIGAGTGILTRHFVGRVGRVYALEPNPEMLMLAAQSLPAQAGCLVCAATAEASGLAGASLDLIAAGQAAHWFDPRPARAEFRRILKPGGWLALVRNIGDDYGIGPAIRSLYRSEFGVDFSRSARPRPDSAEESYLDPRGAQKLSFPFSFQQDWEGFIGSMLSASYMPDEDDPAYPALEDAARAIFARFSSAGMLQVSGMSEVWIGQLSGEN